MPAGDYDQRLRARGLRVLAGVDEVGRGAFAGPLVAAAVILPEVDDLQLLDDSKKLTPEQREELCEQVKQVALATSIVIVEASEIDLRGLHRSNLWALRRACLGLVPQPEHAVVDGYPVEPMPFPHEALAQGDHHSRSVAAASVLAKVTRDRIMLDLDEVYPEYGFARNVGYGTSEHRAVIDSLGPSPVHRLTFHGVGQMNLWSNA